jgi:hypothetical protein
MTSLGRAVRDMLGPAPAGDWRGWRSTLQEHHGSIAAAARAAGVPRRTWRYWLEREAQGKTPRPKPATLDRLRGAVWQAQAPPESAVRLHTRDNADGRPRTLTGEQLRLREGTMSKAAAEYARTGNAEAAARVFLEGINDPARFYVRYLTPRSNEEPEPSDDEPERDDDELDEQDDFDSYDQWYDDAMYEGAVADGDSDTFSGGVVVAAG